MRRLLANWELKVLAVGAAIIFWTLVVGAENTFYTIPDEIEVKAFNVPEDLVIAGDLGTVKIKLKIGSSEDIKNIHPEDFNAYVDLEEAAEGVRDIEIEVSSKNPNVSVLKLEPAYSTVKVEQKAEKEVSIGYVINGEPKEGYIVKEVTFDAENVLIKGAQNALNDISEVKVVIELDGSSKPITQNFQLVVLDENDESIENIEIEPEEIEGTVNIGLSSDQKLIGVQPKVIGTPKGTVWIKSINIEPSFVLVSGDPEFMNAIEYLETQEINVDQLEENLEFEVLLSNLPEGLKLEGENKVKVKIEVERFASEETAINRKTLNIPIVIRKFRQEQSSRIVEPPSVTLIVEGEEDSLNRLSSELTIMLDISDYENEEKTANVLIGSSNIELPEGVNLVKTEPGEVKVSW